MEVPSSSGCGTVNGIDHFGLEVYLLGGTCPELDVTTSENLARMEKKPGNQEGRSERDVYRSLRRTRSPRFGTSMLGSLFHPFTYQGSLGKFLLLRQGSP